MKRATERLLSVSLCLLAFGLGSFIAHSMSASELEACESHVRAAELTQQGNELVMPRCIDVDAALEQCETDQATAASILQDYEAQEQKLLQSVSALEDLVRGSRKSGEP